MSENSPLAIMATRRTYKEMADGVLRVQFDIDPVFKKSFLELFAEIDCPAAIAPINMVDPLRIPQEGKEDFGVYNGIKKELKPVASDSDAVAEDNKGTVSMVINNPNLLAKKLMANGYFKDIKLAKYLEELGYLKESNHMSHVRTLGCFGRKLKPSMECGGDIVAHHVKVAGNFGIGKKPDDWYTIPSCHVHHMNFFHGSHSGSATKGDRDKAMEESVRIYSGEAKKAFKECIGIDSLSDLNEDDFNIFDTGFKGWIKPRINQKM